jgi:hypothetical protein
MEGKLNDEGCPGSGAMVERLRANGSHRAGGWRTLAASQETFFDPPNRIGITHRQDLIDMNENDTGCIYLAYENDRQE